MWFQKDVPLGFGLYIHDENILRRQVLQKVDVEEDGVRLHQLFASDTNVNQWVIQKRLGVPLQVVRFRYLCLVSGHNPLIIRFESKIELCL
jgi:hypothetical protein